LASGSNIRLILPHTSNLNCVRSAQVGSIFITLVNAGDTKPGVLPNLASVNVAARTATTYPYPSAAGAMCLVLQTDLLYSMSFNFSTAAVQIGSTTRDAANATIIASFPGGGVAYHLLAQRAYFVCSDATGKVWLTTVDVGNANEVTSVPLSYRAFSFTVIPPKMELLF